MEKNSPPDKVASGNHPKGDGPADKDPGKAPQQNQGTGKVPGSGTAKELNQSPLDPSGPLGRVRADGQANRESVRRNRTDDDRFENGEVPPDREHRRDPRHNR